VQTTKNTNAFFLHIDHFYRLFTALSFNPKPIGKNIGNLRTQDNHDTKKRIERTFDIHSSLK